MSKNILIVKGGKYAEAEVSRMTAANVEKALNSKGYKTILIEPQDGLIDFLINNKKKIDIIFNALHGSWGEDGKIQGFLEYLEIPYTHSGVTSSALGMNKFFSKNIFFNNNIPVPKGVVMNIDEIKRKSSLKKPFILKPVSEWSSVGVKLVKSNTVLEEMIDKNNFSNYLVEDYIPGTDFTVNN